MSLILEPSPENSDASAKGLPVAHFKKTAPLEQGFNGRQDVYILGDTQDPPMFFGGLG